MREQRVQREEAAKGVAKQALALWIDGEPLRKGRLQFLLQEGQKTVGTALDAAARIVAGAAVGNGGGVIVHPGIGIEPGPVAVAHPHDQHGLDAIFAGACGQRVRGHGSHRKQGVAVERVEHWVAAFRGRAGDGGLDAVAAAGVAGGDPVLFAGGQNGRATAGERAVGMGAVVTGYRKGGQPGAGGTMGR